MSTALLFGLVAASALVVGAVAGVWVRVPSRVLAGMLAFAAGALVTALTFELFEESRERGGLGRAVAGLVLGAVVFTALSWWLDRRAEGRAGDEDGSTKLDSDAAASDEAATSASRSGAAGLALLAAVVLDGVPENLALGVSITGSSGGAALLAAIVVSNLPEALVGSASMRERGYSRGVVVALWAGAGLALTVAVMLGAGPLATTSQETISLPLAFAAGAVIASLADTLMPEAYENGGPVVALATTAGFALSYSLSLV